MKKTIVFLLLTLLILIPTPVFSLTEQEARDTLVQYAYYVYNNKRSDICYIKPSDVQQERIFLGYATSNKGSCKYSMDCNAFIGFLIYNAFQIPANSNGKIAQPSSGDGFLNSSGRVALNNYDGWSSHSSLYSAKHYPLKEGETIQHAVARIHLKELLEPGDLIGVIGYDSSSYDSYSSANKSSHIMMYLGDGNYIHNRSSGVGINSINSISMSGKVGSSFPDTKGNLGPHGSITILKLRNTSTISSSAKEGYRYPTGSGTLTIQTKNGSKENQSSNQGSNSQGTKEKETVYSPPETIAESCSNPGLAQFLYVVKKILELIGIIAPILLIIMASIHLIRLIKNPDDKKGLSRIKNSFIAAFIIFMIPVIVNASMYLLDNSFMISSCWNNSTKPNSSTDYIKPSNDTSQQTILNDPGDYEKGVPKITGGQNMTITPYYTLEGEIITNPGKGFVKGSSNGWNYYLYVPETVEANKPLIIYLHGSGCVGKGIDCVISESNIKEQIKNGANYNTYMLFPVLPSGGWSSRVNSVINLSEEIVNQYGIDRNRICLEGYSLGANGIPHFVKQKGDYFACIVLFSIGPYNYDSAPYFKNIPTRIFTGDSDSYRDSSVKYADLINQNGGHAEVKVYENQGHGGMPKRVLNDKEVNLMSWILYQNKSK